VATVVARQSDGGDAVTEVGTQSTGTRRAPLAVVVAVTAFAVRLWIGSRGGGLGGTHGYDDGVYYAASTSFLHGDLPYRDFVLLHPPGIMLALTPFALLGRLTHDHVGFETARVAWMLLGALNATLVVRICRHDGLVAAAAGGLFYAVWPPVVLTETTTLLEPLVTLGLLVLVWLWRRGGTEAVRWCVIGGLGAGILVDGPFLFTAPTQLIHMVVFDQLGRGRSRAGTAARLAHVLLAGIRVPEQWSPSPGVLGVAGCALLLVASACLGTGRGRFALSLLAVEILVLLCSPSFFGYYNALAGPGLTLVVASTASRLTARPRPAFISHTPHIARALMNAPLALAIVLALTASVVMDSRARTSVPFPAQRLQHLASASQCATSDSPDALLLTDLYSRDLQRGCRVPVDLSGLTYGRDALPLRRDGTSVPRSQNTRWQGDLLSYLLSGQSIFLLRPGDDGTGGVALRDLQGLPDLCRGRAFALLGNYVPSPNKRAPADASLGRQTHDPRRRDTASPDAAAGSAPALPPPMQYAWSGQSSIASIPSSASSAMRSRIS
jgi:alpha-1,2-mannosyltransferase